MLIYYCGILQEAYNLLNTDVGRKEYIEILSKKQVFNEKQSDLLQPTTEGNTIPEHALKTVFSGKGNVAKNIVEIPRKLNGKNVLYSKNGLTLEHLSTIFFFNGIYKDNIDKYLLTIIDNDTKETCEFYGNIIVPYTSDPKYMVSLIEAINQNMQSDKAYVYIGRLEKRSNEYVLHKNYGCELAVVRLKYLESKDNKKDNMDRIS